MKKTIWLYAILMAFTAFFCVSCEKEDPDVIEDLQQGTSGTGSGSEDDKKPATLTVGVVTGDATDIAWNGAKIPYTVTTDKNASSVEAGICVWKDGDEENKVNYVPEENITYAKGKSTKASITFKYFTENTTYHYCAWARMDETEYKGETKTFKTTELVLEASKAVDMGLSVKWAGYNVGATAPEELGDYFAWGETSPKEVYSSYGYGTPEKNLYEIYNNNAKTRLEAVDDAATANWGEKYRMPTCDEKHELLLSTNRYNISYKGVPGVLFESVVNGNYIFFPYTGAKVNYGLQSADEMVGIWTSDLYVTEDASAQEAYIMCNIIANAGLLRKAGFDMDGKAGSYNLHSYRYMGYSVRAVSK